MTSGGPSTQATPRILNIEDVDRLDGNSFETFSALLFSKMGFIAQVTEKRQGDGGIDLVCRIQRQRLIGAMQVKSVAFTRVGCNQRKS